MSMFDQAKEKAEQFIGDAKEKFGQHGENQNQNEAQNENQGQAESGMDRMREQGSETMDNAREQFGGQQ